MSDHVGRPDGQLAGRIVEFLNELLALDRPAVAAMITNRVPCNAHLAEHPTVQAGAQHGGYNVGLLGLLNGLCGVHADGRGLIAAIFEGDSPVESRDLVRFELTKGDEEMKDVPSADVPKPKTETVHYLKDGETACPLSGEQGAVSFNWPRGHVWSQLWKDVTCTECLQHKPADKTEGDRA